MEEDMQAPPDKQPSKRTPFLRMRLRCALAVKAHWRGR